MSDEPLLLDVYPPEVVRRSIVAVAWAKIFSIVKVREDIKAGEKKNIDMEELLKQKNDTYKERKERKKKIMRGETEFIFHVCNTEIKDKVINVLGMPLVKRHYLKYQEEYLS